MKRLPLTTRLHRISCLLSAIIVLVTAISTTAQVKSPAAQPAQTGKPDPKRERARALVESLVNRNPVPKVEIDTPTFAANYDWKEHDRVWRAFHSVSEQGPEIWPELVAALGDERYCITFESAISGNVMQWSVDHVSCEIIGRNLAAAYYEAIMPEDELLYHRLKIPDVARDLNGLKAWCEKRRDRPLYELQIEMCEWAITELSERDVYKDRFPNERQKWITAIKKQIEQLRKTQRAVPFQGFGKSYVSLSK